jgi:hypothetical protein
VKEPGHGLKCSALGLDATLGRYWQIGLVRIVRMDLTLGGIFVSPESGGMDSPSAVFTTVAADRVLPFLQL